MKIAYLLKKFPRLSETFVLSEMLGQQRLGAELHVFSRRPADPEPRHPQLSELCAPVETLPTSASHALRELYQRERARHGSFAAACALLDEGELLGHVRTAECLAEALWLRKRCAELGIAHVHTHFATDSAVTAWLLHRLGGPSYSITAHAKDIYRTTVSARLLDTLVSESAFTVTVCDANVAHLGRLLPSRAMTRVRRLYNGVDLQLFRDDRRPRAASQVLAIGRLIEKKGFHVLVEAAALLRSRGLQLEVAIVGEGEQREALARAILDRGLDGSVQLLGAMDQGAVRERLQTATLLCLPCLVGEDGNRDALPTVLLEAQACGLPCVSTPVSGVPEILDHGRAGLLVPENDAAATADAIARLLADARLRAELARAGRARAEDCFDLARNARELSGWFHEVADSAEVACASPA